MKIHHLRNATFVIECGDHHILIDPMLGEQGSIPPFAVFRHKARMNPLVPMPDNAQEILGKVNFCLSTHSQKWGIEPLTHLDHFDPAGREFLKANTVPVACLDRDAGYMVKHGVRVAAGLEYWQAREILGGKITAVPARHGHSWVHNLMSNGAGYVLELPDEPAIYISGDTVYTDEVRRALTELKPDVAVVAAGSASLDVGGPILMPLSEITAFIADAPGRVVANHMDALNHCPTTRPVLKQELARLGLSDKVLIPADGETLTLE